MPRSPPSGHIPRTSPTSSGTASAGHRHRRRPQFPSLGAKAIGRSLRNPDPEKVITSYVERSNLLTTARAIGRLSSPPPYRTKQNQGTGAADAADRCGNRRH